MAANFSNLHLYLSRKLQDPVAVATVDGGRYTSDMRTDYLNRGNNFIQLVVWQAGREYVDRYLNGLVATQAVVWDVAGTTLATDYKQHLSCQYTPTTGNPILLRFVPSSRKILLDNDQNRNFAEAFTILGGKIYGYYNYSQLATGNGVLYYMKSDVRVASTDATDISIDSLWYDTVVDLAASFAHEDQGNGEQASMNQARTKMVLNILGIK
jgi:hypothetical protein